MYFSKSLILLAAALLASVTPAPNVHADGTLVARQGIGNNCNEYIGDCYQGGCAPEFGDPNSTLGVCTAGTYIGSRPCDKCGSGVDYVGSCSAGDCYGNNGYCTGGIYQNCPCY